MHYKNYMPFALKEAQKAYEKGEVPVGAVIVLNDEIIAAAHNLCENKKNPLYHAEMLAIDQVIKKNGSRSLLDCSIYVTLEPCPMCAGAILNSRIKRLYYGASDNKIGCCGSKYNILLEGGLNHNIEIYHGIMEKECSNLIKNFFKERR